MECLFNQYAQLKEHSAGAIANINLNAQALANVNGTDEERKKTENQQNYAVASVAGVKNRMAELSMQARLLITFSGLCNHTMPTDYNARIASMEAAML